MSANNHKYKHEALYGLITENSHYLTPWRKKNQFERKLPLEPSNHYCRLIMIINLRNSSTCDNASCSADGIFFRANCAASLSCMKVTSSKNTSKITGDIARTISHVDIKVANLKSFYTFPKWWQVSQKIFHRKLWRLCIFEKGVFQ